MGWGMAAVVVLLGVGSGGCTQKGSVQGEPAAATETPASSSLPRVLILGDSISKDYYPHVRASLTKIAYVHRPEGNHEATWEALENLDEWLGEQQWDVIHFNFGLHDVLRSTVEEYRSNLRVVVRRLQKTGAKLIFATSTPVLTGTPESLEGSSATYNEVAREVMLRAEGIAIDDLYGFAMTNPDYQRPHDLHFTKLGYAALGSQVANSISLALPRPRPRPETK